MTVFPPTRLGRRAGEWWPGVAFVAAASVLVAWLGRWGPDWPAQEFRAWIAGHDGLSLWTMRWYGGSALPGYSVLYPPLAAVVGPGLVGVLACVAAAWVATGLAPRTNRVRAIAFDFAVALGLVGNLLIGQLPFLLGVAFGAAALRCALSGNRAVATAVLAALTSLASPLAGAFLLLALPALVVARSWRASLPLLGAVAGSLVAALVGGANGPFPCPWQTFAGVAAFCVAVLVIAPRRARALQVFAASYLLVDVIVFIVPDPVGGNIARLGKLVAGPLACWLVRGTHGQWRRTRTAALAGLAAATVVWPTLIQTISMVHDAADPSRNEHFYGGLDHYLATHPANAARIEIPFTRGHWEAYYVARRYPIARGWERQSDLLYNGVLYRRLTAQRYRHWLADNAITLVALPRAQLDVGGQPEASLLRHPPGYLVPVFHDAHWRVWRVRNATPIVTGAATLVRQQPAGLVVRFVKPGTALVRVRASTLWVSQRPGTCVGTTRDGWLRVHDRRAGTVTLVASLNVDVLTGADGCN
ncbi:MAG TPA: hypothetical protein VIG48_04180 [Jatrophihabitans sp.]